METFERVDLGRSGPSQCFDIIDKQNGLSFFRSRFREVLLVDVIGFRDIGHHRGEVDPMVLVEQTATD